MTKINVVDIIPIVLLHLRVEFRTQKKAVQTTDMMEVLCSGFRISHTLLIYYYILDFKLKINRCIQKTTLNEVQFNPNSYRVVIVSIGMIKADSI